MSHPFADVVIAGGYNTPQARRLQGHDSLSINTAAARGVIAETGIDRLSIDGVFGEKTSELVHTLGLGPAYVPLSAGGISAVLDAVHTVAAGTCHTILISTGDAGRYTDRTSTAPWTRPAHEFVETFGMFTAAEWAFMARRHMDMYGVTPEDLAATSALIRNNGSENPEACYAGRGPFTSADVLASRMVADPYHLLDCAMTSEGGAALIVTTRERAADLALPAVSVLGGCLERIGPSYMQPPAWDMRLRPDSYPAGEVGRGAAEKSFARAGLTPADVDVAELYDAFSGEILRQLEVFGFCDMGAGKDLVAEGVVGPGGRLPITTDGGVMSFSHPGGMVQLLQRVIRATHQIQGRCASHQVADVDVALCSNGGAGAMFCDVLILGRHRP